MTSEKTIPFENCTSWTPYEEFFSRLFILTHRGKIKTSFFYMIDEYDEDVHIQQLCEHALWFENDIYSKMTNLKDTLFEDEIYTFVVSKMEEKFNHFFTKDEELEEGYFADVVLPELWTLASPDVADIEKASSFCGQEEFFQYCDDLRYRIVDDMMDAFKTLPLLEQVRKTLRERLRRMGEPYFDYLWP